MKRKQRTRIKKIIACAVAGGLILAVTLTAVFCGAQSRYRADKYNKTTLTTSGGSPQPDANINEIAITSGEEGTVDIRFYFVAGSEAEGGITACGIPEYSIAFLPDPLRLMVTIKGLVYWDYVIKGTAVDETGVVSGLFQMLPQDGSGDTVFYLNLAKSVTFQVREEPDGVLAVSLKPEEMQQANGWYLLADLYYEYQAGEMPACGFTPTLCDDNISVLMISEKCKSREDAQQKMDELLTGVLEGEELRLVELAFGELPKYSENTDSAALLNESILSIDGAKTSLPLFFADARFLCWIPGSSTALFVKTEDEMDRLYTADKAGARHLLFDTQLATVIKAVYSADGSTLAYIERAGDIELCSIYRADTGNITVIGGQGEEEPPLGEMILGIALNDDGSKLYVISGNSMYSLKEYDVTTGEVRVLDAEIIVESDLSYHNGYLYYCDVVEEWEVVVQHELTTDQINVIQKGAVFSLSNDGSKIAVITEDYETAVCDLNLVDISSGESTLVLADIVTSEFFISSDNSAVYYILETGDEELYYQINRYDIQTGETTVEASSINGVFYASNMPDEIIISIMYNGESGNYPVSYIASFQKNQNSQQRKAVT